jgi:amino acid adenylation domain-containing protein
MMNNHKKIKLSSKLMTNLFFKSLYKRYLCTPDKTLSCFIIGKTVVLPECAELLINAGFTINGILTDSSNIESWAREKQIPTFDINGDIHAFLVGKPFDFIFSIINEKVLSPEVLSLPRMMAINYHDAPLPIYAGVNSNTWALVNQETEYGISWHVMEKGLDTGAILQQPIFEIAPDDTVIDLNLKCNTAAVRSFKTLIDQIIRNELVFKSQDLTKRTYVAGNKRPQAGAILQWDRSAEDIYALFRALRFSPFDNPLAVPRLMLDNNFFLIEDLFISGSNITKYKPGTVIRCVTDEIVVSTLSKNITIRKVMDSTGQHIPLIDIIQKHQLHPGKIISSLNKALGIKIQTLHQQIGKKENFWKKHCAKTAIRELPNWKSMETAEKHVKHLHIYKPKGTQDFLDKHGYNSSQVLFTLFAIYLVRVGSTEPFSIAYSSKSHLNKVKDMEFYFESHVPFHINIESETTTFSEFYQNIKSQQGFLEKYYCYTKDFTFRRIELKKVLPILSELPRKVAIREISSLTQLDVLNRADIELLITDPDSEEWGMIAYRPDKVQTEAMERAVRNLETLMKAIIVDHNKPVTTYPIVSETEREIILNVFNTKSKPSFDSSLVDLFDTQVTATPDNIAVIYKDVEMSYRQLDEASEKLAIHLHTEYSISTDDVIALQLSRSEWMIISILAVLKAGAAYLPIAVDAPIVRSKYMISAAKAKILLTDKVIHKTAESLKDIVPCEIVDTIIYSSSQPLNVKVSSRDLAYLIYTSGSTGKPKGVMIEHGGVVNMIRQGIDQYGIESTDCILQFAAYTFDTSVEEIFIAILSGATLVMADREALLSPASLMNILDKYNINVFDVSPQYLKVLNKRNLGPVKSIISGGELPISEDIEHYSKVLSFYNSYGPTEASIIVTLHKYSDSKIEADKNYIIGKPIPNVEILILDSNHNLLPIGVEGELCIAGECLARGYINEPSSKNFIAHPFKEGERLYKTGDIARWLRHGHIEYRGRKDSQVKLRGYRIELGEIEHVLSQHESISEAVVIKKKSINGFDELVAYVIGNNLDYKNISEVKIYLKNTLPDYMNPSVYVLMNYFPLLSNFKIDRKALPDHNYYRDNYINVEHRPTSNTEIKLSEIWKNILSHDHEIGLNEYFLDLGGSSLLAVLLVTEIEKYFEIEIPLQKLIRIGALGKMAHLIDDLLNSTVNSNLKSPYLKSQLSPEIYRQQMLYLSAWQGIRKNKKSLIQGRNIQGSLQPIFWCCQGGIEFVKLSNHLGSERPSYFMRSGHLLKGFTSVEMENMARLYADEIEDLSTTDRYILGANCQAGDIILKVAYELIRRGNRIDHIFLLEHLLDYQSGKIYENLMNNRLEISYSFLYGEKSFFNPFIHHRYPLESFNQYFPGSYEFKSLPCGHGQFFESPFVKLLAGYIQQRIRNNFAHEKELKPNDTRKNVDVPLTKKAYKSELTLTSRVNAVMKPGEVSSISTNITNRSNVLWKAEHWICLGNRWVSDTGEVLQSLDARIHIDLDLKPGSSTLKNISVQAPRSIGKVILKIDLIQEGLAWFEELGNESIQAEIEIKKKTS